MVKTFINEHDDTITINTDELGDLIFGRNLATDNEQTEFYYTHENGMNAVEWEQQLADKLWITNEMIEYIRPILKKKYK